LYNEPALKTSLDLAYDFDQKWSANLMLFAATESEDVYLGTTLINEAFVDLNLKGSYQLNNKMRFSLKLNNLLNQNYSEFSGYQVQGFQVLGGFSYLFNL
jgi:outer membrane cobalamin receptor